MKNQIISLDKEQGRAIAEQAFKDMCGYNRGKVASQKTVKKSLESLKDIYNSFEITALVSQYEGFGINGANITLDGEVFICDAFKQIAVGEIERIYIYLLTVGELNLPESNILNKVYYDMWQDAYMDAGQEILRQHLQHLDCNKGKYVSDNFGPGFYGMEVSQLENFFAVLDGEKIHVKLLDNGFISPQKSYAGFFLVTGSKQRLAGNTCSYCLSSRKTCMYCKLGRNMA